MLHPSSQPYRIVCDRVGCAGFTTGGAQTMEAFYAAARRLGWIVQRPADPHKRIDLCPKCATNRERDQRDG